MKKSTMLAFTAAALMSAASMTGYAAGSPTYDDNLILPNPAAVPTTGSVVLVPVASPQTVQALHTFVQAWQNAEVNYTKAKVKHDNHEQLTKAESKWLHSKDQINAVVQRQKEIGGPMTNDESQALEDAILDIMAQDQEHVNNEDLRHMMNETVWYAAKETVKNKASEEPTAAEEHVVDLKKAINEPMEPSVPHTIDLRKAIQQ